MAEIAGLTRGSPAIAFTQNLDNDPSLPPAPLPGAQTNEQLIQMLLSKATDLETKLQGKVDKGSVKSEIAIGSELIKIQADQVAVVGEFTVVDIDNERTGTTSGQVAARLTRIVGDVVQTGAITSNNWGSGQGTAIDLDNETVHFGGSASPKLYFDGSDLFLTGTLQAGAVIANSVTVDGVTLGTISTNASTGATHAGTTGNPHSTTLLQIAGDLDDIADGSTYFKSTANQNTGGTRAYNAFDSSFDYIRAIQTQKIVVSGSNPTNGSVIDSAGFRGYSGGSLTVDINVSGATSYWYGNLYTDGQVFAEGSTTVTSETGSVLAISSTGNASVRAINNAGTFPSVHASAGAVGGQAGNFSANTAGSEGLLAGNSHVSGTALRLSHTAGGIALDFGAPKVNGDVNFLDDVDIDGTLNVDGATTLAAVTMDGDLTLNGNNDIRVDRSVYVATDASSGDSSLVVGSSSGQTGLNTIVVFEGTAGAQVAGQFHLFGQLDSGQSKTTLGLVLEATVESGTGAFTGISQLPLYVNSVRYKWPLEAY